MLTQLQLEGPELEPLLARVRSELGPQARIVHAEKVRSGGIAGFFASQRFELTVEVDTSLAGAPAPAAAPAPQTDGSAPVPAPARTDDSAIAGRARSGDDDTDLLAAPTALSAPPAALASTTTPARAAAHAYAPQSAGTAVGAAAVGTVTAALSAPPPPPPPPPPAPPPAGPAPLDEDPLEVPAVFAPHAAFAGFVGAPAAVTEPTVDPAPTALLELADRVSAHEHGAVVSTESSSFAALLSRLHDEIGAGLDGAPFDADDLAATGGPVVLDVPAQRVPDDAAVAVRPAAELARPEPAPVPELEGRAAELARLGLPPHLRPSGTGGQLHTALRASLTRLPTAPPAMNRAGTVLALVGPLSLAVHVAREIAEELGLPAATSVAVATCGPAVPDVPERQVLHAATDAAERRSAWRRRSNLTLVAVDAPLTATGAADARAFLAALSPSATWGVVEATRKAQDVGSWTRALGGVHALALTDLEDTSDPAAVLELGIPVSRLGGRPATARAWATLLTGRLAA